MSGIQHILIATDFSDGAQAALRETVRLAKRWGCDFSVLHVTAEMKHAQKVTTDPSKLERIEKALRDDAEEKLAKVIEEFDVQPKATEIITSEWNIECAIQDYAKESGVDLIIISTHSDLSIGEFVRGTTASRLMRTCDLPILTARPDADPGYHRILVAVDFEGNSARCVEVAAWICAHADDCELHLIHANQLPGHGLINVMNNVAGEDFHDEIQQEMGAKMSRFLETVELHGVSPVLVFSENSAHFAILDYVEKHEVDLVCLGTRAHGALEAFFVGSTAEKVLRDVTCSVLTVHGHIRE